MIQFTQTSTDEELEQILALQKRNLPANISEEDRKQEGFVTVEHDFNMLKRMHNCFPHTIAKDGNSVVGYTLSMHPSFADDIPVLKPMFKEIITRLEQSSHLDSNFIVMGQVCVALNYRKKGLFRKLYETMRTHIQGQFSCIITEVDAANSRSLEAHYAIGFKSMGTYHSAGQDWELIYLN